VLLATSPEELALLMQSTRFHYAVVDLKLGTASG
jgi:two-component system response regulator RegA